MRIHNNGFDCVGTTMARLISDNRLNNVHVQEHSSCSARYSDKMEQNIHRLRVRLEVDTKLGTSMGDACTNKGPASAKVILDMML